jgi:hypothetical protein
MNVKYCKHCGEQIHPKRLEILPTAITCVGCSTAKRKGAVTLLQGEGDHTWVETIFLEHDEYQQYMEAENKMRKIASSAPKAEYNGDEDSHNNLPTPGDVKIEE